jgi:hypothetical protein
MADGGWTPRLTGAYLINYRSMFLVPVLRSSLAISVSVWLKYFQTRNLVLITNWQRSRPWWESRSLSPSTYIADIFNLLLDTFLIQWQLPDHEIFDTLSDTLAVCSLFGASFVLLFAFQ